MKGTNLPPSTFPSRQSNPIPGVSTLQGRSLDRGRDDAHDVIMMKNEMSGIGG